MNNFVLKKIDTSFITNKLKAEMTNTYFQTLTQNPETKKLYQLIFFKTAEYLKCIVISYCCILAVTQPYL